MTAVPQTRLSITRPIWDYARVKQWHSSVVRGKHILLRKSTIASKVLLNIGCGSKAKGEFINLDYNWRKTIDICWDICTGIPLENHSLEGIFTEHCLEHIPFHSCQFVLKECRRLLRSQGTIRIVVPDAELYLRLYHQAKQGETVQFPNSTAQETTAMMAVNRIFRNHGHQFAYDAETMMALLENAGFTDIQQVSYNQGRDPRLLIDSPERQNESLYLEAIAP